jgi:hypothetical protein
LFGGFSSLFGGFFAAWFVLVCGGRLFDGRVVLAWLSRFVLLAFACLSKVSLFPGQLKRV